MQCQQLQLAVIQAAFVRDTVLILENGRNIYTMVKAGKISIKIAIFHKKNVLK